MRSRKPPPKYSDFHLRGDTEARWLIDKELRELAASRSYWLLLIVVGILVGHAFITSANIYAEASGAGGGPAALSQGLSPLEGLVVPTFGAYDLAATLLFPFVVIRLVASEKQTGALDFTLQSPVPLGGVIAAKGFALVVAWLVAMLAGGLALLLWKAMGGHLGAAETWNVVLGHVLRGILAIGIASAAAAVSASAASAAIVALTITVGTWALEYIAAARGGAIEALAEYTPGAALRVFEHGELRLSTVLVMSILGIAGLALAAICLDEGRTVASRARRALFATGVAALLCVGAGVLRTSRDVSEDRRNSFPRADERALASITAPVTVTIYLAAEDPRLVDLERGVLAKLQRTMRHVSVVYAAKSRSGLFETPGDHYGEIWYDVGGKREMTRSSTEEIVLETIYRLAGVSPPAPVEEPAYRGYPLRARPVAAPWLFFGLWPLLVAGGWFLVRRPRGGRSNKL